MNYISTLLTPKETLTSLLAPEKTLTSLLETGYLPHAVIRPYIRRQLTERLSLIASSSLEDAYATKMRCVEMLRRGGGDCDGEEIYEIGSDILTYILGPRMKFSACFYEKGGETLAQAEIGMLRLCGVRGEVGGGMAVLDLGCGWGSTTLYLAEIHPTAHITGLASSPAQKTHIETVARRKGLSNVTILTGDILTYDFAPSSFDRVLAIEILQHTTHYTTLLSRIALCLKPTGKLFLQTLAHRDTPYMLDAGWLTTHFFRGGLMPSADLLLYFQEGGLRVRKQWWVGGRHYARTCEDWLGNMGRDREGVWPGLLEAYGHEGTVRWWNRWQVFFLVGAEMGGWGGGDVWGVCQYLFERGGG
ncbi:methyltransferase domain-containing protein [Dothidotthia symphoricarpi CBS 119687]|uniref:Methyltransferase domain-containing protein n=1 Tax=Dothidotthia symphoricarpi CBS 119687 TaxID=1392245 RepID=A0A6A6ABU7_9PLEO|nr:methyltransferase domain-containing protein [Dothidotthia symphoricarpi CBS 119687]KAF2128368.1 methyltransferase domain-containing protein [Dothidotthia symphoricarpi CBS 119687]